MNAGDHDHLMMGSPSGGGKGSTSIQAHVDPSFSSMMNMDESCSFEQVSDFLKSLRALKIREDEERKKKNTGGGFEVADSDLPHLEWISELVK